MKVFFDTSVFIAFFIEEETYHQAVTDKYLQYRKQRATLLTSEYILDELYTRLMYDFGKNITQKRIEVLSQSINKRELQILNIDEIIFKKALDIFIKFGDHPISFTDATTYVLFKTFALDEIFTLDNDFKKMRLNTSF